MKLIKNNRGDIATPILTIFGIVAIVAFLVVTFQKLEPAVYYIKANQVVRKYSLIMENQGGLNQQYKLKMIDELKQKGINVKETEISAPESSKYGDDLTLKLNFNYNSTELILSGFDIKRAQKLIPIVISRSTVSRKP